MKRLLPKLTARLQPFKEEAKLIPVPKFTLPIPDENNETISHLWLWPRVGKFFKAGDVIVAETGESRSVFRLRIRLIVWARNLELRYLGCTSAARRRLCISDSLG